MEEIELKAILEKIAVICNFTLIVRVTDNGSTYYILVQRGAEEEV